MNKIICYFFGHKYCNVIGVFSCYIKRGDDDWARECRDIDLEECNRCGDVKPPTVKMSGFDNCLAYGARIELNQEPRFKL